MTRNNDTSYRQQGRAVALAAIMILSVVGASVAFSGGAAAVAPQSIDENGLDGSVVYPGQEYNVTVDTGNSGAGEAFGSTAYLVEISKSEGSIDNIDTLSSLNEEVSTGSERYYEVDTIDTEPGNQYAIASRPSFTSGQTNITGNFSTINEGFDAEFDVDSANDGDSGIGSDADTFITLDNDRSISEIDIAVQADGLSYDQLADLFNVTAESEINGSTTTSPPQEDLLPLGGNFGPDRDDGDTFQDLKDEDVLTIDLSEHADADRLRNGDELYFYPEKLADGEGFPDDGDYEFEFTVTDTQNSASDTLNLNEQNIDASFAEGSTADPAGDISEFEISFQDTSDAYVQIGGPDVEFVEVLYIEQDDDEPVEVDINTRLLGTNSTTDAVYDYDNAATFESAVHGNITESSLPAASDVQLFGDDGLGTVGSGIGSKASGGFDAYVDELIGSNADTESKTNVSQLTRPLQATDYQLSIGSTDGLDDEGVFDANNDGNANNQLDSKTMTLEQPTIEGITVHKAPEGSADDTVNVSELVSAATPTEEVAIDDRVAVQIEATGIYGALVAGASNGTNGDGQFNTFEWDRYNDGEVDSRVLENVTDARTGIDLTLEAESATGNTGANEIDLDTGSGDVQVVIDEESGDLFIIADTSDDNAFTNDAPEDVSGFTAELEYDADEGDDRFAFDDDVRFNEPFNANLNAENYPYVLQGEENSISASTTFDLAPREISFDNLNADQEIQAQATDNATFSASTNVAPGSDAEIRIVSSSAEESFRVGNDVTITDDGSISSNFDLGGTTAGDQFNANFRVGGSQVDTASGVIVETIGGGDDGSADDGATNETDGGSADDGSADDGSMDDGSADDGSADDGSADGGSTDDGTPGFGAVVALVALVGAALLAVRRQN